MKILSFLPFLNSSATQIRSFPSVICERNSLSPHFPMGLFFAACWSVQSWIQIKFLFNVDMDESSKPRLSHQHAITFSWTRSACQWDSHHTTILQLDHKRIHPGRRFNQRSSRCMSYFLRLKRGYSFL